MAKRALQHAKVVTRLIVRISPTPHNAHGPPIKEIHMTTPFSLFSGVSQVLPIVRCMVSRVVAMALVSLSLSMTTGHAATSPLLLRNTFLGGAGDDSGQAVAVDNSGNIYVAGSSNAAWGAPVRPYSPASSAFVAKLDSEGTLLWNTFLGGSTLSATSIVNDIAVDGSGNVYVTGESNGTWGSPVRPFGFGRDAFAAKLNASGALVWNTFLGGSADDGGRGIGVDNTGAVYVGGTSPGTWGAPVRAYSGSNDAFVVRLDPNGVLVWNTFVGGAGLETAMSMAVDGGGNAYITGIGTATWGAPIRAFTAIDGFVAKVGPNGSLVWNTFVGSALSRDFANGISANGDAVYVTGSSTDTWGSPVRAFTPRPAGVTGSFADAFVVKLRADGTSAWNTFLGGSADDSADGVAFDGSGNVYVSGSSTSSWASPALAYVGSADAFTARLDSNGSLVWNAFLGCAAVDMGTAVAVDGVGNVLVGGFSAGSWGTPVRSYTAGTDTFVAKLRAGGDDVPPVLSLPGLLTVEATTAGGATVEWTASAIDANDGAVAVQCTPDEGSFFVLGLTVVECSASDAAGNVAKDSFQVMVVDTTAPAIATITATPNVLGVPNHKMIPVKVTVSATDGSDANPSARIIRVTSSEPVNGTGDGDTAPDWIITGPLTLQLRAERAGKTQDRVYTITVEVKDRFENATTGTVQVRVRK
jgi:hypothetical protein